MGKFYNSVKRTKEEEEKEKKKNSGVGTDNVTHNRGGFYQSTLESKIGLDTLEADLNTMGSTLNNIYGSWQTKETMDNTFESVNKMYTRLGEYQDYYTQYGKESGLPDLSELLNNYKTVVDDWENRTNLYGQYKNADAYTKEKDALTKLYGMTSKDIEPYLKDKKNTVAYTTASGHNITWKELYDSKYTNELYEQYSVLDDFKENSKYKTTKYKDAEKQLVFAPSTSSWDGNSFVSYYTYTDAGYHDVKYDAINGSKEAQDILGTEWMNRHLVGTAFPTSFETGEEAYLMNQEELDVFNYLYHTKSPEEAYKYHEGLYNALQLRENEALSALFKEFGEQHPIIGSAISVLMSPVAGIEQLNNMVHYGFTGEQRYNTSAIASGSIRGGVTDKVDLEIAGWDAFDFVYNSGMSMADSVANTATFGGIGGAAVLGLNSAAYATNDALDRGLSNDQAFWTGFSAGVFEAAFESLSIGHFKSLKEVPVDSLKTAFKNIGKSMLVNASEETLTELANIGFDMVINGDMSEYATKVRAYEHQGLSKEEARSKANWELHGQVAEAGASGAFMGLGFGGTSQVSSHRASVDIGKTIRSNDRVSDMLDTALMTPKESEAYEAYTRYANKGVTADNITDAQIGNLYRSAYTDAKAVADSKKSSAEQKEVANKTISDLDAYISSRGISTIKDKELTELFDDESVTALIESGLESGKDTNSFKLATEFKAKVDRGEKLSAKEIRSLYEANKADISAEESADVEARMTELGKAEGVSEAVAEGDVSKIAKAIERKMYGETLTEAESKLISDSKYGLRVYAEKLGASEEVAEAVEYMDKAEGKLFFEQHDGVSDINEYTNSFQLVTSMAENNYSEDAILKAKGSLSAKQLNAIYAATVTEKYREKQRNIDKLNADMAHKMSYKGVIDDSVINYGNEAVKGKVKWSDLNSRQREAVTFISGFAKATGMNLKLIANDKKKNGSYDPRTNTITIDVYAGISKAKNLLKDTIIPTMSHETTHWMKEKSPELYRKMGDLVFKTLEAHDGISEVDRVASEVARQKAKGKNITDDGARDEIIARACEDMLKMSEEGKKYFNSLSESEKKTFIDKVKEILANLMEWVDNLLNSYSSDRYEAKVMREYKDTLAELSKMWDEMLVSSAQNNSSMELAGVFGHLTNGVSEDGTTIVGENALQMSDRTYREGGRDFLVNWLENQKGISEDDKLNIIEQTDRIAELMRAVAEDNELPDYSAWADMEVVKDENGEKLLSVIVKNGDYAMNIDFSQVCKKRVALNAVLNAMVQSGDLNVHTLTETDVAELNAIIKEHDFEIACALCFVDSKRYRVGAWAESFCDGSDEKVKGKGMVHKYGFNEMVRSLVPKGSKLKVDEFNFTGRDIAGQPTQHLVSEADDSELDFTLIDKIMSENDVKSAQHRYARAIKEHPEIRKILNKAEIISSIGLDAIRLEAPELYKIVNGHQGTAKPKFSHDVVAYGNDILKASNFTAEKAKMVGGVRCQSFSDFMANMVVDYAQFISELSAKGLTSHSYTKEPLFVKLFGLTGMKINMSLVPKAIDMTSEQQKQFAILKDKNANKRSKAYKEALAEYNKLAENAGLDENGNYIWEDETFPYDIAMDIVVDPRYSANCGTIAVGISNKHILKLLADDRISMVIPYHKSGLNHEVAMMRDIALYNDYTKVQSTRFGYYKSLFGGNAGKKLDGVPDFDFYGDLYGVDGKDGTHDPKTTAQNYLNWCDRHNYIPKFDEFRDNPNYYKLLIDFRVYDVDGTYREQQPVKAIYPSNAEFKDLILNGVVDKNGKVYGGLKQQQQTSDKLSAETQEIVDEYRQRLTEKYGEDVLVQNDDRDDGYDSTALLKESTIDTYLKDYASKSSPKYAQAYITYMSPSQFLNLTTSGISSRQRIINESTKFDREKFEDATHFQPIKLTIDHESGEVIGHEGRHRMVALSNEGIRSVPVLLFDSSNKYNKVALNDFKLIGQFNEYNTETVGEAIPLSYENRDLIAEKFGTMSPMQRIGAKYGFKETLQYDDRDDNIKKAEELSETDLRYLLESVQYGVLNDKTYIPLRATTPKFFIDVVHEHSEGKVNVMQVPMAATVEHMRQNMEEEESLSYGKHRPHNLSVDDIVTISKEMGHPTYIVLQENGRYAMVVSFYNNKTNKKVVASIAFASDDKDNPKNYKYQQYMNGYNTGYYNIIVTQFQPDNLDSYLKDTEIVYDKKEMNGKYQVGSGRVVTITHDTPFIEDSLSHSNDKFNDKTVNNDGIQNSDRDDDISVYEKLGELDRVLKERDILKEDIQRLHERLKLEGKVTNGKYFTDSSILNLAGFLLKKADSKYDKVELARRLKSLYHGMTTNTKVDSDALWNEVLEIANDIALMAKPKIVKNDYALNLLKEIKGTRVRFNSNQKAEAKAKFGGNWNQKFFGRIILADNANMELDEQWKVWAEEHPKIFDANVKDGNQVTELYDIINTLKEQSEVVEEYNKEEFVQYIATEILGSTWNLKPIVTTADKYTAKIKEIRSEHKQAMKDVRDSYDARVDEARLAERMFYGKKMSEMRKEYDAKLEKQRKTDSAKMADKLAETREQHEAEIYEKELAERMHFGAEIAKLRRQKEEKVAEAKEHGKQKMAEYKENIAKKTKIQSITRNALDLVEKRVNNSKDKHIPEIMLGPVDALLDAINFSSKRLLDGGEPTKTDISLAKSLSKIKDMMAKANSKAADELIELYGHGLDESIEKMVENVDRIVDTIGDNEFVLNRMSLEDLQTLDNVVKTIKQAVNKLNKFHVVNHAKGIANLSQESMVYLDSLGKAKVYDGIRGKATNLLEWGNALPYYAFKRYGEGGMAVYEAFQDGWDKFAFNVKAVMDYAESAYTNEEVKAWSKEVKVFNIPVPAKASNLKNPEYKPEYQKIQMTVPQIMSMYCLNKRVQARGHFFGGGIRVADFKDGKGKIVSQSDGIVFMEKDISAIFDTLTDRQKAVADKLQEFMNTVCTDWGNEVSMARFGYKAFGEANYFPIQSDKNNLAVDDETEQQNSLFRLLNMSFTKSVDDKANNRIVISDIFDVFAQHSSDMAKYNALALPVLDAFKWYNYKEKQDVADGSFKTTGVKQSIETAFGKDGQSYFTTFLKDINGQKEVSRDTLGSGFFTNAKIAAVGANLRVVALQPTSYVRASAVIDSRYLTRAFAHKPKIDKAEKWCGIALWKSMGYYDTNIQRGVVSQIKHDETGLDKAKEKSMKLAEMADKITWGYLWNACELEIRDKRKDLEVGSDEFYTEIGKRLREVIYATQVVDSTMTRSQMMRSSQFYDKMLTAFASEPTLSYNMLQDAYMGYSLDARRMGKAEAFKKNGKRIARTLVAYTMTNALAALVESGFDAFREDDDEEEMDLATFMKYYLTNFLSDMSITAKIPYVKEAHSVIKGFGSSRTDTQWMDSMVKAGKAWAKTFSGEGSAKSTIKYTLKAFSDLSGLPFYNVYRDSAAFLDKTEIFTSDDLNEMFEDIFN